MARRRRSFRDGLDEWHGTAARYIGLGLLVYSVAIDRFRNPALFPGAIGLVFLKNVTGKNGNGPPGGDG